jgi:predicted O-methyltransferase YrrM
MTESKAHPHVAEEKAHLFNCTDGTSTEDEYVGLLRSLIRCSKPNWVLESGTYTGVASQAIAKGLIDNGFGQLVSCDPGNPNRDAVNRLWGMSSIVTLVKARTWDYLEGTDQVFDFAFFDSDLQVRANECELAIRRKVLQSGAFACFHDTSKLRTMHGGPDPMTKIFWNSFEKIRSQFSEVFEFPLSRGFLIARVR